MNPKEVSAARLTGDPRRDEDGDDKDHGVTGDGGSHALTKHAIIYRSFYLDPSKSLVNLFT